MATTEDAIGLEVHFQIAPFYFNATSIIGTIDNFVSTNFKVAMNTLELSRHGHFIGIGSVSASSGGQVSRIFSTLEVGQYTLVSLIVFVAFPSSK